VGAELRGDDAAGLLAAGKLKRSLSAKAKLPKTKVFLGGTAPENLTGPIKAFRPSHVIVIDAAEMGQAPGSVRVIDPQTIADAGSFSTHNLPLNVLTEYLRTALDCRIVIVAIQPARWEWGQSCSPEVSAAAGTVAKGILQGLEKSASKR
jgi:hydrogenase 3 maturation protease